MSARFLVGTRKGLFVIARAGSQWDIVDAHFVGDNVNIVTADPRTGHWFAAFDHGHFGVKLKRSTDEGRTWEEVGTPAYPPQPKQPEGEKPDVPWKTRLIWSLEPGGPDEPGVLWAGTVPGGLFKSKDNGQSWALVSSLWNHPSRREWMGGGMDHPGIHSICVDPRNSKHVRIGVSCAGVWLTLDGGETWKPHADGMRAAYMPPERAYDPVIQDPHRVAQCRAQPDVLWAQHHNGVFHSRDGGARWNEIADIPPSTFGFAVAVHPQDGDTAWLIPAIKDEFRVPAKGEVVVNRTRDGGRTFETLRNGLPQRHAYDLVYRHALDIDRGGNTLAFGSTTGSLWVTDDQGDRWQHVSAHLPPIYCVRAL